MDLNTPAVLILILAAALDQAQAPLPAGKGRYVQTVASGDLQREFVVDVPTAYDGKTPLPVVVVLHGWTGTDVLAEKYTRMAEESEKGSFIAIFPQGLGKPNYLGWNVGWIDLTGQKKDDVKFVSDALDYVEKELKVDTAREYVCGHSNGAFLANLVGSQLGNRVAAVASVAGTIGNTRQQIPDPVAPVSVLLIHGMADNMVSYAGDSKALLRGIGARESAKWWAKEDGCGPLANESTSDGGNVITTIYSGGKGDADVELVTIKNGSHSWPGGWQRDANGLAKLESATGVDAADLIWNFFKAHPKH
jgi:polyhydroxybutyrate depolymerase